jgi:DNA-binding IclR family transcriptional regulator
MVACAVPVTDSSGKLCACLFTHAPVMRKSLEQLISYAPTMQNAAKSLGQLIDNPE